MSEQNAKSTGQRAALPKNLLGSLDDVDKKIVDALVRDGRQPNNALAARVGIAASTCLARTRSLIDRGIIRGFRADIDYSAAGADLQAVIFVRVRPAARPGLMAMTERLANEPGVLNVFFIAGAYDFLIHIVASNTEGLRTFVAGNLSTDTDIESTQTSVVFEHLAGQAPLG
ncbi:MAG TPA: Lrp/AsnC family transcriptional regulator [Candidatus Nanopelagicales bacterium]|nr:Lrp/AsnC family transcriptional regulator [Candidatus Nanopelagicales bacterium]